MAQSFSAAARSFFSNAEEDYLWRAVIDELKAYDDCDDEQDFVPANPLSSKFWRIMREKNYDLTRSTNTYSKKFKRMWLRQEVERLSAEDVQYLTKKLGPPQLDQLNALPAESDEQPKHYALFGESALMEAVAARDPELYNAFVEQTTRVNNIMKELMVELGLETPPPPPTVNGEPLPKKRRIFSSDEERRRASRERHRAYGRKRKFMKDLRSQALPKNELFSESSTSTVNEDDMPALDDSNDIDEELLTDLIIPMPLESDDDLERDDDDD